MSITLNDIGIIAGSLIAGYILATIIFKIVLIYIKKLTAKTTTTLDDKIIAALERPLDFAIILLVLNFALEQTSLATNVLRATSFEVTIIVLITYILVQLFDAIIGWYEEEIAAKSTKQIGGIISTLQKLGKVIIILIGTTMILHSFGIEVTPIIAALGIGGLAVALAFQDTLSNFFSGVYITVDRPIKEGDFIELENGQKGHVVSIGWRTTKIKTQSNYLLFVPNSKLAQATLVNYHAPTKETRIEIECSVSYNRNLEKVEKIAIETAREIQKTVKAAVPNFEPFIRFHTFGDNGINFTVYLYVQDYAERQIVIHEFIKALHEKFAKEGIEIPFPQRTIHFTEPPKSARKAKK